MTLDPVVTNPEHYRVVFENDRVRVLEYTDVPGDRTTEHAHPDSVMVTLSSFRRRLHAGPASRDVELTTGTHALFVELKDGGPAPADGARLGPE